MYAHVYVCEHITCICACVYINVCILKYVASGQQVRRKCGVLRYLDADV